MLRVLKTRSRHRKQRWVWKLTAENNEPVGNQNEGYTRPADARRGFRDMVKAALDTPDGQRALMEWGGLPLALDAILNRKDVFESFMEWMRGCRR